MLAQVRWSVVLVVLSIIGSGVHGQEPAPKFPADKAPKEAAPVPPAADAVAAKVNGQSIPELAVYRALLRENGKNYDLARKEVLNFLIDNVLIDQYLQHLKIEVESKAIDEKIEQIKAEAKKNKTELEKILKSLFLTEQELRYELSCALRWEKFVDQQGTDKALKELFERNINMFDGTRVQARHILVKTEAGTTPEQATVRVAEFRKSIEQETAQELGKLPAASQNDAEKAKILEKVFSAMAAKESACPSRKNGGDLGWFARNGDMVEPFARTAFALKAYELSEPVNTEFGCHLILATDRKPGKEVKFEDVRPFVRSIYSDRLREAVIAAMRPRAQIVMTPKP